MCTRQVAATDEMICVQDCVSARKQEHNSSNAQFSGNMVALLFSSVVLELEACTHPQR